MGHDFEFEFEVVPVAEVAALPEETIDEEDETPLVLIVDDEPLIVDSLAAILVQSGLAVMKAYNGAAALELAISTPPDLLLTDVAMPGMNGIRLAMAVAGSLRDCRVLLFSAHASTLDLRPCRAVGFDFQLLAKPLHPRDLLRQVHATLENKPAQRKAETLYAEPTHAAPWRLAELNA